MVAKRRERLFDPVLSQTSAVWVDTRSKTGTIEALITGIGATVCTLLVNTAETFIADATIPSTMSLKFTPNGSFSVAVTKNVDIQTTNIRAGNYAIFSGAGDFDFADGTILKTSWFASFEAGLTYIGPTDLVTYRMTEDHTITVTDEVTSNITLKINRGAILSIANGITLTISGNFEPVLYQVFSGVGSVLFGVGAIKELNYIMFGADPTGIVTADQAMLNCHTAANAANAKVVQNTGTFLWEDTEIEVTTNCDLSGTIILTDSNSGTASLTYDSPIIYKITGKNNISLSAGEVIDLNANYTAYTVPGSLYLPMDEITEYKNCLVLFETTTEDIKRQPNNTSYLIKDQIIHSKRGELIVGFNANLAGIITAVTIVQYEDSVLEFKSPQLNVDSTPSFRFIQCLRSRTIISGFGYTELDSFASNLRRLINFEMCDDVKLIDGVGEAQPNLNSSGVVTIFAEEATRITLDNYSSNTSWGTTSMQYIKQLTVKNSNLNRVDGHWAVFDVTVQDSTIKNHQVQLAGGGFCRLQNITWLLGAYEDKVTGQGDTFNYQALWIGREDVGWHFNGAVLIDNVVVRVSVGLLDNSTGWGLLTTIRIAKIGNIITENHGRDTIMPHTISVTNITVELESVPVETVKFDTQLVELRADNTAGNDVIMPKVITISDARYKPITLLNANQILLMSMYADHFTSDACLAPIAIPSQGSNDTNAIVNISRIYTNTKKTWRGSSDAEIRIVDSVSSWGAGYAASLTAWKPDIHIDSVNPAFIDVVALGRLTITKSLISRFSPVSGGTADIDMYALNCQIVPVATTSTGNNFEVAKQCVYDSCAFFPALTGDGVAFEPDMALVLGSGNFMADGLDQVTYYTLWPSNFWLNTLGIPFRTLDNNATPSVARYDNWITGGTVTITDFDDGVEGRPIYIIAEHAITITDGTNIFLNGSSNFVMAATDTLTLMQKADGKWYEIARSDNT